MISSIHRLIIQNQKEEFIKKKKKKKKKVWFDMLPGHFIVDPMTHVLLSFSPTTSLSLSSQHLYFCLNET